jgi:hypothetical protein
MRLFACYFLLVISPVSAGVDFSQQIRPILEKRCFKCHGGDARKGGVALDTFHGAQQITDSGVAVLQQLLPVVTHAEVEHRMPKNADPLPVEEISLIKQWVAEGAAWPDDGWRPAQHWAYAPPVLPQVPGAQTNAIDAFIDEKLAAQKLQRSAPAEPAQLLRRLHLDLTGLPPGVAQIEKFEADPSDAAYETIVDALLANPAYGEKWARPWLDAARYADTEGYQRDTERSMWPWRDWVIAALNADMPFDQFTIEQLAGDLLPNATLAQKIATGFQRNSPLNLEAGTDPNEDHYKYVVDRVNTLGSVWLGTTLGCAQCHNHKYDPISTKEYYQLYAAFNQTPLESQQKGDKMGMSNLRHIGPEVKVPLPPAKAKQRVPFQVAYQQAMEALEPVLEPKWQALYSNKTRMVKLPMEVQGNLGLAKEDRDFPSIELVINQVFKADAQIQPLWKAVLAARKALEPYEIPTVRVMQEQGTPRETFIAKRGDFLSQGEAVQTDVPAALPPLPKDAPRNRLGIARWLVGKEQPLTPRVLVNRLWAELFGRGIVPTLEEFGKQGEPPSHPELLDWLAVTFRETDAWSLKKMIRRIVLSGTYRQSSAYQATLASVDPQNALLARHPGHRLDAEAIRDQALVISQRLKPTLGGPPVYPWQPAGFWRLSAGEALNNYVVATDGNQYRRGLYTIWRRGAHYPAFAVFDAPDRATCTLLRGRSSTPLQALALMNDEAYRDMAAAFAKRITQFPGDADAKLARAFRTVLARKPTASEHQHLRRLYEAASTGPFDVAHVLLNLHETLHRP